MRSSELLVKQECSWWAVGLGWGSDRPLCALARSEQLMQLYSARQRRRLNRGLRRKQHSLLKRLRKAKKDAPPMENLQVVKTHLPHNHPARNSGRLQLQDLQPGGNQA